MPTKQDDRLDPGQQEYEKNFDFEQRQAAASREPTPAGSPNTHAEQRNANPGGQPWSFDRRSVGEREAAPNWDMNVSKGGASGGSKPNKGFNPADMLKKRATKWIIGGIISTVISASVAIPAALSGALVHLKELSSDWANRNNHSYSSKRAAKTMKKKYFQADANCNSGVKCRYKNGVNDKAIEKFKAAGLNPEVETAGNKKYIKAFNTTDVEGNKVRVTADNFEEHYGQNVRFRGQMDTVAKPKAMLLRGKQTLKLVFNKFGILRNRDLNGKDNKEQTKKFRADIYSDGNANEKLINAPPGGDDKDAARVSDVEKSIQEAAAQERQLLESTDFEKAPSIVPDVTNFDLTPDKAADVAGATVKGGLKGAVLGVFSAIDKACSGYQLIRATVFGAKVYKVAALIKYAGVFMTIADKLKAGDASWEEISFIMGLLFRPSTKKDSFGKTFFQGEGFNLISQGKIADQRGLARFTNGTSFLTFLQGAQKEFERLGANKSTCKQVQSWYGQLALGAGGLALGFFSGATTSIAGAAGSAALGMMIAVLAGYVTPLLIQYAAGTVAPDPTDPEGGYGASNAMAAGIDAFGNFTGRANGERVLTSGDAATVEMESNQAMAFMDKVDNYGKSPFSLDSSSSIPSKLALALAPVAASPFSQGALQSVASVIASPLNLFSSSFGSIVTNGASAQSDVAKGGHFCADEDYREMGVAVSAFCTPIVGEKKEVIDDPKFEPELVDQWMFANGHADPESGEPKSDDYKKYIASCVDSTVPLSPDGGGAETTENVDTRWCISTDDKFDYFRFFTNANALESAMNDSIDGTLGIDEGAVEETDDLTGNTYENGKIPEGDLCELGEKLPGHRLRCDAANKFGEMAAKFRTEMGSDLKITDSYRTYDEQVKCKEEKADGCAEPGTSNHGCGQAVDFASGINTGDGANYNWIVANAGTYGWKNPDWAKPGGSKPEPWHWEYGTDGGVNNGTCQL